MYYTTLPKGHNSRNQISFHQGLGTRWGDVLNGQYEESLLFCIDGVELEEPLLVTIIYNNVHIQGTQNWRNLR